MVLKRVLMSVDFPRPDSPGDASLIRTRGTCNELLRTNDHGGKLEALADALPVDLVGEVGDANTVGEGGRSSHGERRRAGERAGTRS